MGLVVESDLAKYEKIALIETIKECNDIELITSVLKEFNILDEQKANFLTKAKGGLKLFGNKVRSRWLGVEKNKRNIPLSQLTRHFKQSSQATPPGSEIIQGLSSALS